MLAWATMIRDGKDQFDIMRIDLLGSFAEGARSYALMSDLGFPNAFKLPR